MIPEVLDCIEQKYPNLGSNELNNVIAGYFNSALGIGEAVGPISSGLLVEALGFRSSQDVLASVMLTYALIYFAVSVNFTRQLKAPTDESLVSDDF